jgi:hypothetical protein
LHIQHASQNEDSDAAKILAHGLAPLLRWL